MRGVLAVAVLVLLLRVPFLNQAIQGDDVNYLGAAQYAQIDPAHPQHLWFVFQGERVTMQGHPHPPLNAWVQAGILAVTGDVREPVYHGVYILFSLIAGWSALSLARRFSRWPLGATALFLVTPAFVVNGNSLESDLPLLAFWLAGMALFVKAVEERDGRWLAAAALVIPLAAMAAFQAGMLAPLLGLYLWQRRRDWKAAWMVVLVAPAVLVGWQVFEKLTSEQLPAEMLARYFRTYNLQSIENKLKNARALTVHLGTMVFPALPLAVWRPLLEWVPLAMGFAALAWCVKQARSYLAAWVLVFFSFALVVFFAGSARYLLPVALPVAILVVERMPRWWVVTMIGLQAVLGVGLAAANYEHWDAYRKVVARMSKTWEWRRVWVDGEMGLRFYAESAGALPVVRGQAVRPGDVVISSKLLLPVGYHTGGGTPVAVHEETITPRVPLRLFGLGSESAYSSVGKGFLPFEVSTRAVDVVKVETIAERKPVLEYVAMNDAEAAAHIVSGIDQLEEKRYRWMNQKAVVLLKAPAEARGVEAELYFPPQARAKKVVLRLDGEPVAEAEVKTGALVVKAAARKARGETAILTVEVDETFQVAGDQRTLGAILVGAGFR